MRLADKTSSHGMGNELYAGKYKGCVCNIVYSTQSLSGEKFWYFYCYNKDDTILYNSLRNGGKYDSKEECHDACVTYIDVRIKEMKGQGR